MLKQAIVLVSESREKSPITSIISTIKYIQLQKVILYLNNDIIDFDFIIEISNTS